MIFIIPIGALVYLNKKNETSVSNSTRLGLVEVKLIVQQVSKYYVKNATAW